MSLSYIVYSAFNGIIVFMIIMALLSWFPNVPWYKEPFKTMRVVVDIIVGPFRRVIPPIGMLDISFMVACFAIWLIGRLCVGILLRLGL